MTITLNGTTGITTPDIDSIAGFDGEDLTGDVAAARITGALNASGSAPLYACRAWVNFNGTGTVAIRGSGNVSSITDSGVGLYSVNLITALPDTNYVVAGNAIRSGAYPSRCGSYSSTRATSSFEYNITESGTTWGPDAQSVDVAVFR